MVKMNEEGDWMDKERNNFENRLDNIDILKSICAFLVVCIHVPFPGWGGEYFTVLARVAVPIFFMITGYFYTRNKGKKQIRKILRLVIEANTLYFVWKLLLSLLQGKLVAITFIESLFKMKSVAKFIILNDSPVGGHLWYLGAILYVLVIVFILDKINCRKLLYYLTPILLIADLIFGKYSLFIWHHEFPYILVRNFLFVGIPYFGIGNMIREKHCFENWNKNFLRMLIVVFSVTGFLERFMLLKAGMNATRDHYISTTLLAICLFVYALKSNWTCRGLAVIGKNYSTWLYIIHPIFITILEFNRKGNSHSLYRGGVPIMVYFFSLVFIIIFETFRNTIKGHLKNN